MFQTEDIKKIKKIFMLKSFSPENLAVYEITLKNMVEANKPQMTVSYGACALDAK
jgi:hypothetical protein